MDDYNVLHRLCTIRTVDFDATGELTMGLDMYAYTAPAELVGDEQVDMNDRLFSEGKPVAGVDTDFAYWRKFNHLHGWMEKLYRSKGGESADFNCNTVRLMPADLDRLEAMASMKVLAPTAGFFFGGQEEFNDEDKQEVLDFIAKARQAIADGKAVVYDSWW